MNRLAIINETQDITIRPYEQRPRDIENWNEREKVLLSDAIEKYQVELKHIKETNMLPEGWTWKTANAFRRMRLISQSGEGWKLNRSIEKIV